MKLEADLTRSQDKVALQECELHKRAGEVQARHEQMERERVAALQDACAHCVGLVLHNTKTTLRTASDSIAEHCAMSPNQVAEATPGNKYPLLALLTGGSGRVTQLPGITAKTVQAWRDEFLAPGGTLILALLRSGLNPTGTDKTALIDLHKDGMRVDVLLDFCYDSSSTERFHPPAVSTMNLASFARFKELMPPPPPPPADFESVFSWSLTDCLSLT